MNHHHCNTRTGLVTLYSAALLTLASGCAYQATVPIVDTPHSPYGARTLPGAWELHVSGHEHLRGDAESPSFACGAHNYPFDYALSFRESMWSALSPRVNELRLARGQPEGDGVAGVIRVQATDAGASVRFRAGIFVGGVNTSASIAASITVEANGETLMQANLRGDGWGKGSGNCPVGAAVLQLAAEHALRDLIARIIERLESDPALLAYAEGA